MDNKNTNAINLYNPNDKPFGKLSNNSYHPISIDRKTYPTVTNYIFSNMLVNPIDKILLQKAEITGSSGENKELIRAIDYLLNLQKSSKEGKEDKEDKEGKELIKVPREVMLRKSRISYLSRRMGKDKEYYKNMSDEKIKNLNANVLREERLKQKESVNPDEEKAFAIFEREKEEDINRTLLTQEEKEKLDENLLLELKEAENKISELEKEKSEEKEKEYNYYLDRKYEIEKKLKDKKKRDYINYISDQVQKPFIDINLQELKNKHLEDAKLNTMGIYKLMDDCVIKEYYETVSAAIREGFTELILGKEIQKKNEENIEVLKHPKISETLLATGNVPIIYQNNNDTFLGVNNEGNGENIVGKTLMQIRYQLTHQKLLKNSEKEEEEKHTLIYNIYLAYSILYEEMYKNRKNLKEYLLDSPEEIIQKYHLVKQVPSKETVIQMYTNNNLNEIITKAIDNPKSLVINVRKYGLENLKLLLEEDTKDIIFKKYIEYIINRKFDDQINKETDRLYEIQEKINTLGYDKKQIKDDVIKDAISQQLNKLTLDQLNSLKNRIVHLFKLGMLSASLSDEIDVLLKKLMMPTQEEIDNAKKEQPENNENKESEKSESDKSESEESNKSDLGVVRTLKKLLSQEKNKVSKVVESKLSELSESSEKQNTEPIIIYSELQKNKEELKAFRPENYNGMLNINNRKYPTIEHYILAKLIANTGFKRIASTTSIFHDKGRGIEEAYKLIQIEVEEYKEEYKEEYSKFKNIQSIVELYNKENLKTNNELSSLLTLTALHKKFEDKELQKLLLLTDENEIRWMSPYNRYLNLIYNNGENYVGIVLMDIRKELKEKLNTVKQVKIEPKDILRFIETDDFIKSWIERKLKDMTGVVYKFQQYFKIKNNVDYNLLNQTKFIQLINLVLNTIFKHCNFTFKKNSSLPVPKFITSIISKSKGMATGVKPVYIVDNKGNSTFNKNIQKKIKETNRKIHELENKLSVFSSTIQHTKEEAKDFDEQQRLKFVQFFVKIKDMNISQEDKNKKLIELKNKQKEKYNEFWGIIKKIDKEYEIQIKNEIQELKDKLGLKDNENKKDINGDYIGYIKKLKKQEENNNNVIKEISEIYWHRIISMLSTVIQIVDFPTEYNIQKYIVDSENILSEKPTCDNTDCIVSAILNLLYYINMFKEPFSSSKTLDLDDVKLAISIILNTELDIKKIDKENEEDDRYEEGEGENKDEDNTDKEEENEENEEEDEENKEENEEDMYFPDNEENEENTKRVRFAFKTIDNIKNKLNKIMKNSTDYTNIAEEILKSVDIINKSKTPTDTIKQNRINFFKK